MSQLKTITGERTVAIQEIKDKVNFVSALREYRARKLPNFDAAGFHAQQCIEKYLKGLLQKHSVRFE
ncbi:MAG: HEPN domain-containing protein [Nitrospiria bacterium]